MTLAKIIRKTKFNNQKTNTNRPLKALMGAQQDKTQASLFFPLFWLLTLLTIPLLISSLSLFDLSILLLIILLNTASGAAILLHSNTFKEHFIFWPVSLFLGNLLVSILIIFSPSSFAIPILIATGALAIISLIIFRERFHLIEKPPIHPLALFTAMAIPLIYFFISGDAVQAVHSVPFQAKGALPDSFFFTLVAHSYSQFPFSNSFFDYGAELSYQPVAFFPPALLTKLSGIPAQVTLWSIWMPFYMISAPLIIAYTAIKYFFKSRKHINICFVFAVVLFYSLAPINPKYLISLNIEKIVWLGTGYLLPGGNPPYTAAMLLGGIILFLFFSKQSFSLTDKILMVVLTALLIKTKIAFYIPFGIFIGVISLLEYFKDGQKERIKLLLLSLIPALLIYLYPFTSSTSAQFFFNPGYYVNYFMKLTNSSSLLNGTLIMIVSLALWGGIRFLVIAVGLIKKSQKSRALVFGALTALILSLTLPLLLRLKMIAPDGTLLQDVTFDLVQFVRGGFFIFTIAGMFIIFSFWKEFFSNKRVLIPLVLFCGLVNMSNITRLSTKKMVEENQKWRTEVRNELNTVNPEGLLAIKGSRKYSGQLLAAEGYGPWWFTTKRGDGSGYIMGNKNYYRAVAIDSIFEGNTPEKTLNLMKTENVEYIIATPETKPRLDSLQNTDLNITRKGIFKWLYKID